MCWKTVANPTDAVIVMRFYVILVSDYLVGFSRAVYVGFVQLSIFICYHNLDNEYNLKICTDMQRLYMDFLYIYIYIYIYIYTHTRML